MEISLKEWELKDAADLARVLSNRKILNNLRDGLPYPYTEQNAKDFISYVLSCDKNSAFVFAIMADGKVAGCVSVFRKTDISGFTGELGYYVAEEYWGKGIATLAVSKICQLVFEHSNIVRIYAELFSFNKASCRVLENVGFSCEGILKNGAIKNGVLTDKKIYALSKS